MSNIIWNIENWLNEIVDDRANRLQDKIEKQGLSKIEAIKSLIKEGITTSTILQLALEKLDAKLSLKYSDEKLFMVCSTQIHWIPNKASQRELVKQGFQIKNNKDSSYSVIMGEDETARLFVQERDAIKYIYGSADVIPLNVKL